MTSAVIDQPIQPPLPHCTNLQKRNLLELLIRGNIEEVNRRFIEQPLAPQLQVLLLIVLAGLFVHGSAVSMVAGALTHGRYPQLLTLPIALPAAFLVALMVCLPSFYFYTQLSGLDASFRMVTAQGLRCLASTAVRLLGILPFYGAYALAYVLELVSPQEPSEVITWGLCLPFIVGLHGIRTLYRSFSDLLTVLPITHQRRGRFLLRMVLAWAAVFTSVAPLALWRLTQLLAGVM